MNLVNKENAACRQLDAAIELFFSEGDSLAIYALASAVFMITENIYERKNPSTDANSDRYTFWGYLKPYLTAEEFSELKVAMGKTPNFLKHANRENDKDINDLNEVQTGSFLAITAYNFQQVFGYATMPMKMIIGYFLTGVDDSKILMMGYKQEDLDQFRKFRNSGKDFLKQSCLQAIYQAKGVDVRKTQLGQLILNP